ncbi:MAG: transglutaminase domain-containing protein [Gemmataceae bacterium]
MNSVRISLACCLLLFLGNVSTATADQFDAIDKHALNAPKQVEQSIPALARYLTKPAKTDAEKARAIYRWVTNRIRYDVNGFRNPTRKLSTDPKEVLRNRVCICEGYVSLIGALAKEAGLDVVRIFGKAKGARREAKGPIWTPHAWNAVKCDGKWRLLDATWGSGILDKGKFVQQFDGFYFFPRPEKLILSHLPKQDQWQLLNPPLSEKKWSSWPKVPKELLKWGFPAKRVRAALEEKAFRGFVKTSSMFGLDIKLKGAPLTKHLKAGSTVNIQITAPSFDQVVFANNKKYTNFTQKGTTFEGEVVVQKGTLLIAANIREKGKGYWVVLEYVVE